MTLNMVKLTFKIEIDGGIHPHVLCHHVSDLSRAQLDGIGSAYAHWFSIQGR